MRIVLLPQRVFRAVSGVGLLLLLTCIQLGGATTDPVATSCQPLCGEFANVANQCGVMRNCYDFAHSDTDTFIRCLEPCWDLSAPCFVLCADNFGRNFDTCETKCSDDEDYTCVHECFDENFASLRDSTLTVPDPDIGPFVNDTA